MSSPQDQPHEREVSESRERVRAALVDQINALNTERKRTDCASATRCTSPVLL